ncbi:hypothetical protein, partial [Pseudomonas aeruginosa]|uniref:hypothetical protein n=1 Tax=Pseudomonas aeruginosa TaxID=287 RepID=UPI002F919ABA
YRSVARHCIEALAKIRLPEAAGEHGLFEVVDEQALSNDEATPLLELRLAKEIRPIFEAREASKEVVMRAWRKLLPQSSEDDKPRDGRII